MDRDSQNQADLIDLGTASAVTHGAAGVFSDETLKQPTPGLSDD